MGQMNIKHEALIAGARALAGLLGSSVTDAVRPTVEARHSHEGSRREDETRRRVAALMAMTERASKRVLAGGTGDRSDPHDAHGAPA